MPDREAFVLPPKRLESTPLFRTSEKGAASSGHSIDDRGPPPELRRTRRPGGREAPPPHRRSATALCGPGARAGRARHPHGLRRQLLPGQGAGAGGQHDPQPRGRLPTQDRPRTWPPPPGRHQPRGGGGVACRAGGQRGLAPDGQADGRDAAGDPGHRGRVGAHRREPRAAPAAAITLSGPARGGARARPRPGGRPNRGRRRPPYRDHAPGSRRGSAVASWQGCAGATWTWSAGACTFGDRWCRSAFPREGIGRSSAPQRGGALEPSRCRGRRQSGEGARRAAVIGEGRDQQLERRRFGHASAPPGVADGHFQLIIPPPASGCHRGAWR